METINDQHCLKNWFLFQVKIKKIVTETVD